MAKIEINIRKIEGNIPKPLRLMQRSIFNTLCKKIFADAENPPSQWTKEDWADPHKVFIMEDTPEKCKDAYNDWVNMKFQTWDNLKTTIKESKTYRLMPYKARKFLSNPNNNDQQYWEGFQNFLITIGILFTIELKK